MNNTSLNPLFPSGSLSFELIASADIEAVRKQKALPFDVVRNALANLYPEGAVSPIILREKVTHLMTSLSSNNLNEEDKFILKSIDSKEKDPMLHNCITDLVDAYRRIDSFKEIHEKSESINLDFLLELGDFDKALEICNNISETSVLFHEKSKVFGQISNALLRKGDVDKSLEIANKMSNDLFKEDQLQKISIAFAKIGNDDKAVEVANRISYVNLKEYCLSEISLALTKIGNVDKALEIYFSITDINRRSALLLELSQILIKKDNTDKALEIAKLMHGTVKNETLFKICVSLALHDNFDKFIEISDNITDKVMQLDLMWKTSNYLNGKDNCEIEKIIDEKLQKTIDEFIGNSDKYIQDAKEIIEDEERNKSLSKIVFILLIKPNNHNVEKSTEVANLITDLNLKNQILNKITQILSQGGVQGGGG
jgi:tetratricopeptide (TPR) repeat protein